MTRSAPQAGKAEAGGAAGMTGRTRACTHKSGTLVDLAMSALPWQERKRSARAECFSV
jgi:hypothetical protein